MQKIEGKRGSMTEDVQQTILLLSFEKEFGANVSETITLSKVRFDQQQRPHV